MPNLNNLTGKSFGLWRVLHRDTDFYDGKHTKWICQCECGTTQSITSDTLLSGRSTSCGCRKIIHKGINVKHGMSKTRIYAEWNAMKRRCKPNTENSKRYSDRGISVCKEWEQDFLSFCDLSTNNGYNDSLTLDRIDNDKGYSPDNCRWVSLAEQQSNKSNTIIINYHGENYCLRTLCLKLGFPYKTAYRRLKSMRKAGDGINTDKLFAPIQKDRIPFKYRGNHKAQ